MNKIITLEKELESVSINLADFAFSFSIFLNSISNNNLFLAFSCS